jgi:hypothetical protein
MPTMVPQAEQSLCNNHQAHNDSEYGEHARHQSQREFQSSKKHDDLRRCYYLLYGR